MRKIKWSEKNETAFQSINKRAESTKIQVQIELIIVKSYWLMKKWVVIAVYLKMMRKSVFYIEVLFHKTSSFHDFSRFIDESRSSWFIELYHLDQTIFVLHRYQSHCFRLDDFIIEHIDFFDDSTSVEE